MHQTYLFGLALTSTVVLLTAFILHGLMHRTSAASRRSMWIGTFVALAVGVLAGFIPTEIRVSVQGPRVEIQPMLERTVVPPRPAAEASNTPAPAMITEVPAAPTTYPSLASVLTVVWLLGVFMMVVRWMASHRRVRRLLQHAAAVTLPEFPAARVRESEDTVVPFLAGFVSAVIVLPARWRTWSVDQLRAAVFHELGHAAVRDHWFQPLVELMCAVHWFNPLVWSARRRLYLVREMAADDHALLQGLLPSKYARVLVDVSAHCVRSATQPALSMARTSGVSERVVGILDGARLRTGSRGWLFATTCILLSTAVGLGCLKLAENNVRAELPARDKILARIDDHQPAQPAKIVVGVVVGDKQMIVTTGGATEETVFGVGSISELFIELAFADMVVRGEIDPDAVVHDNITFIDLASHASGLPALPDNFAEGRYSEADLDEFLAGYRRGSSDEFVYSYLGVGLQGDRLAARAGTNYRDLVRTRILEPLGLDHTDYMGRDAALRPLLATGHAIDGAPLEPRTDAPLLGACCAVRTNATDLLALTRLFADSEASRFARAVDFMRVPRTPTRRLEEMVGVGFSHGPNGLLFKRGGGRGFRSYVAVVPSSGVAVVVLANHESVMTELLGAEVLREVELTSQGPQKTLPPTILPENLVSVHASFDAELELIGARVEPAEVAPGDTVEVSFYYRALGDIDRDWKIFVHGDGPSGAPRLHADHYPKRPTTTWPVGAIVQDTFTMTVPPDYPQPHFTIWTGLYQGRGRMTVTNDASTDGVNRVRGPTVRLRL